MRISLISFLLVVLSCLLVSSCSDGLKLTTPSDIDNHFHLRNYDVIITAYPYENKGSIRNIFFKDSRDVKAQKLYINGENVPLLVPPPPPWMTIPQEPYWEFEYLFENDTNYIIEFIANRKGKSYISKILIPSKTYLKDIIPNIDGSYTIKWELNKNSNIQGISINYLTTPNHYYPPVKPSDRSILLPNEIAASGLFESENLIIAQANYTYSKNDRICIIKSNSDIFTINLDNLTFE